MIVQTRSGAVRGERGAFLGVQYAAPITQANRFGAPEPAVWDGVRDATQLGAVCPQLPTYGPVGRNATSALVAGEDFLTLNIRTPSVTGHAPVLVWVHGGGYAVGSANEPVLQSGAFAASGIVEVTVNYRLGAMGFLHLDGCPDNRGLLDLIAALEWVRDNIAAFGGDPTRVTFAGRSAGGFAVAAVMAMPAARGLFAQAMPQSGASTGISTPEDAAKLTRRMQVTLGADPREVALSDLLVAQRDLCNESYERHDFDRDGRAAMLGVPFVPVIGPTLPLHPEAAAAQGLTAPVPMMTGCTTGEYLTHSTVLPATLDFHGAAALLHERVRAMGHTGAGIVARYREALPDHGPHGIWRAVAGDLVFQNPTTRFARLHGQHNPVWKYLYGPDAPDEAGAPHGAEVGAVWYRDGIDLSRLPERQRVADTGFARSVHRVWAEFIHGRPEWRPEAGMVLRLADRIRTERDPFDARTALWERP